MSSYGDSFTFFINILSWVRGGVTFKAVYSYWKLDLFALLTTTTNYIKSSTVITASIILQAHLIFTLRELVILPTSQLPWPTPDVQASTDSS
jgi:hypothetical protein